MIKILDNKIDVFSYIKRKSDFMVNWNFGKKKTWMQT